MSAALLIDIILWGSVAAVGFIAFQRGRTVLTASLREGAMDFVNIVPRIALGGRLSALAVSRSRHRHGDREAVDPKSAAKASEMALKGLCCRHDPIA